MQKFVVKKISRSTNILLSSETEQSSTCGGDASKQRTLSVDSEGQETSNVKMSGYLKKKRNRVGGWSKLYFVLQNGLLMSYNSREEYEKKLVSFKDVICLIPNNTVLLPSLEPRFTIATNLHTFYTFRCDDNRTASKWITAILECLSRDFSGSTNIVDTCKKTSSPSSSCSKPKAFLSQPNLTPKRMSTCNNHSWEHLPKSNWIVTHNGRILMELSPKGGTNRAKLPIHASTAKLLQKCSANDVITSKQHQKVRFNSNHQVHDENQNLIRDDDRDERNRKNNRLKKDILNNGFNRFENNTIERTMSGKRVNDPNLNVQSATSDGDYSTLGGTETQEQNMLFGDETGDYSSIYMDKSIDSKNFNNTLTIDLNGGTRNPIASGAEANYAEVDKEKKHKNKLDSTYAKVDMSKKQKAREMNQQDQQEDTYEEIGAPSQPKKPVEVPSEYEMIDIPLAPTQKSRTLVWKNWSNRIQLLDFAKRFKGSAENLSTSPSTDTLNKRQKISLTFSDFSKRFSYRSMRDKAKSFCNRTNGAASGNEGGSLASSTVTETESESSFDKNNSTNL